MIPAARAASGGPDAFGYRFIDSAEPGLSYNFEDISATGTDAGAISNLDDAIGVVPVGFSFSYYGNSYTDCTVSTDGLIGFNNFGGTGEQGCCSGDVLPSAAAGRPNELIAGMWTDLDPLQAGTIYYQTLGSAPNRRLIIQFDGVRDRGAGTNHTFQFKLFETSNVIEIHYQSLTDPAVISSIGIENASGTDGLQYFRGNTLPPIGAGPFAVRFSLPTTVTNTNDSGAGSLRQAILDTASGGTINFAPGLDGGSILLTSGQLLLNKSLAIDASGLADGITVDASGSAGAPGFRVNSGNTVSINKVTVTGSSASGIVNDGMLTLSDCEIVGNTSNIHGGGIRHGFSAAGGSLTLVNCAVLNNTAGPTSIGGGLALFSAGTVELRNVTLAGNVGGAPGGTGGGGIYSQTVALTLNHVTIADNTSRSDSGGLRIPSGTFHLENTIIANNSVATFTPDLGSSPTTRAGINFIGSTSGSGLGTLGVDYLTGDPMLGPLAENGGPTQSMLPLEGAPVVDPAGAATSSALATDQRGLLRVADGNNPPDGTARVDIGAVEHGGVLLVSNTAGSGAESLRQAVADFGAGLGERVAVAGGLSGQTINLAATGVIPVSGERVLRLDASGLAGGVTVSAAGNSRIFSVGTSSTIELVAMTLTGGDDPNDAGAIENSGTLTLDRCTLFGNSADFGGGAITNRSGAILTLTQCTLSGNSAPSGLGGAIENYGQMSLTHCTIAGNSATTGGGIGSSGSGTTTISNCIVSDNAAGFGADVGNQGTFTRVNANIIRLFSTLGGGTSSGPAAITDDPVLSALGNFGGPVQTRRLLVGSQALNAAAGSSPATDQRGFPRPAGGADLGAVEEQVIGMNPASGTANTSMRRTLSWAGAAPGVTHEIFVGTSAGSLVSQGTGTSPFAPTLTNFGTTHHWRVDTLFNSLVTQSPVFTFTTRAKNFVVNTAVDENNGFATGGVSLRDALNEVVTVSPVETITFSGGLNGQTLTVGSELVSSRSVIIDSVGLSDGVTLSGGGTRRVLSINGGINVTLRALTFTGGSGIGAVNPSFGGALYNAGTATVERCTFSGNNPVNWGGAIRNDATLTLTNCTLSGNTAGTQGGAIYNHTGAVLMLSHCTISGNSTNVQGGGIANAGGGTLALNNSIVTDNSPTNITGGFTGGNNLTSGDARLAALADNGGPNETRMLLPGSPAIDAAGATALVTDQRGFERPLGSAADIGAYEAGAGTYTLDGLTLRARMSAGQTVNGVVFEISSDPNFEPTTSALAGLGTPGTATGSRESAQFSYPSGVAEDAAGNVFIADTANNRIQMMTPGGIVSKIAGNGYGFADGPGSSAKFALPASVAVGPGGNVFVADTFNHRLRKLTPPAVAGGEWTVTTLAGEGVPGFADGNPTAARFNHPQGLVFESDGNLLVADSTNERIRRVTPAGQVTTRYYSGGFLDFPTGLALDSAGNLFVAEPNIHAIWKIDAGTDTISLFSGGSVGFESPVGFDGPTGLAIDADDNLYVADKNNHAVRKITPGGLVSTIAGNGSEGDAEGKGSDARFRCPQGLFLNAAGHLLVADTQNHRVRRILVKPITVMATVAPNNTDVSRVIDAAALGLNDGVTYYFRWRTLGGGSQTQTLGQSFFLQGAPQVVTTAALPVTATDAQLNGTVNAQGSATDVVFKYSTDPGVLAPWQVGTQLAGAFTRPRGIAAVGGERFVADESRNAMFRVDAGGTKLPFAGALDNSAGFINGAGAAARFDHPAGVAADSAGNLYVADEYNHCIRKITTGGVVSTFAGSGLAGFADGAGGSARFLLPKGVAVDAAGNVYVADTGNHRIRKITPAGVVSTLAGTGTAGFADGAGATAQFRSPEGVAVNAAGIVHVTDTGNHRVRLITAGASVVSLAGNGSAGFLDGTGTGARFSSPVGIAIEPGSGRIYVCDRDNHRLRSIASNGAVTTLAGSGVAGALDSSPTQLFPATTAQLDGPSGLTINSAGRLVLTQPTNGTLREVGRLAEVPEVDATTTPSGSWPVPVLADTDLDLLPGSTYYFRACGSNARGTIEGEILNFTTPQSEIVVYNGANTGAPLLLPGQEVDFGTTPIGISKPRTFTIENIGNSVLNVSVAISGTASGGFSTPGTASPTVTANGGTTTFTLTLQNGAAGMFTDQIVITSDDPNRPTTAFTVRGKVLAPPVLTAVAAANPTANGITFSATVNPSGDATKLEFEYSKDSNFEGTLEVRTAAGSVQGFANGCGGSARFDGPQDVAVDRFGNVYVADTNNHRIRKIAANGDCTVFAGSGVAGLADGVGAAAKFSSPGGLAVDLAGNLFVADTNNHRIRRITPGGNVTTVAGFGSTGGFTDGIASAARFNSPSGIAVDAAGNLYVADPGNFRVRKIDPSGEVTSRHIGNAASVPEDVEIDAAGNVVVALGVSNSVLRLFPAGGSIAFGGSFVGPGGLAADSAGNVFVADRAGHRIRKIAPAPGNQITTIAGTTTPGDTDGTGTTARFTLPSGIAVSSAGTLFVADTGTHRVRQINLASRTVVAATNLLGSSPVNVVFPIAGLEPNTTYFYRALATNGGGKVTVLPLDPVPGFTFTTLDNNAALSALQFNGDPVDGFNACIYSYVSGGGNLQTAVINATASSPNATLRLFDDGVFCCNLTSGVDSAPLPLEIGLNQFQVEVSSADGSSARTYTVNISRAAGGFAAWQAQEFGSDAGNPAIAGALANPDDDDHVNLLEYAFDLDPHVASTGGVPTVGRSGGFLTITYRRLLDRGDISYTVEWSTDMLNWSNVGVTEELVPGGGSSLTEDVLGKIPDPERRKFIRVTVTQL